MKASPKPYTHYQFFRSPSLIHDPLTPPHLRGSQPQPSRDKETLIRRKQDVSHAELFLGIQHVQQLMPIYFYLLCWNKKQCHGNATWMIIFKIKDQVMTKRHLTKDLKQETSITRIWTINFLPISFLTCKFSIA